MRAAKAPGFTLVELMAVLLIVGVLAAQATARYIELGRDARRASLQALTGALWSAATGIHMACPLVSNCDPTLPYGAVGDGYGILSFHGTAVYMNYGYPGAGDNVGGNNIDSLLTHAGFSVSIPDIYTSKFSMDGAPDPANCAVSYREAASVSGPTITTETSGC
jgi:MSHA pilin protein MshA